MASEDRAWEEVQIKAFTYWANGFIPQDMAISDLTKDFGDGLRLIALSEALTKSKLTAKYMKNPKTRVHFIENIHLALVHLSKSSAVKVASYGTEDFADGRIKPILGFLWSLLRHFRVNASTSSEGTSFEDELLAWVNEQVDDYGASVSDFVRSFADGRTLLALLHKYDNTYVDWDNVSGENKVDNCTNAMHTALEKIGIPQLMDPLKLASGNGDEKSMILYLSLIQQAFVRKFANQAADAEKTDIRSQLKAVTSERDELLKAKTKMEEELTVLRASNDEWKQKCKELEEENERLRKALAEANKRLSYLEEKLRVMEELQKTEAEERAQLEGELQKLKDENEKLRREKRDAEEERDEYKRERDALASEHRDMMDSMEAFKNARAKMEHENDQRNKLGLLGLDTLRQNLLEHLRDMHVWKTYLEQDRQYQSEGIQVATESSIAQATFEDQLSTLSSALSSENTKLQTLLKDREREEAEKKANKEAAKQ